ncbi:hypothetical protein M2283_004172 [Streptomyces pseudovenezuelae]|uniref:N-acetylmuramoyl-L-alanine amidase domain-containing protein n=1 Tax=Streptomyces pseudovenezuelae TaxID=67350 RepID=A0ABT6LNE1_9ACTN|nr:hypothetical protein [Streptomyces pseudovenezuelae]
MPTDAVSAARPSCPGVYVEELPSSTRAVSAVIRRHHGWSERSVIGHKEWQPGKQDPRGFTMGCGHHEEGPGPEWTEADRTSYRAWQYKLGFKGKDADGSPGKVSWDKLKVPAS